MSYHPYRDILFEHFDRKKVRNTRYSLRAFARDLEVPVSRLSDVFSGKRAPSLPLAIHLAEKLELQGLQKELFITSVQVEKEKISFRREIAKKKLVSICEQVGHQEKKMDPESSIANSVLKIKSEHLPSFRSRVAELCEQLISEFGQSNEGDILCNLAVLLTPTLEATADQKVEVSSSNPIVNF